MFYACGKCYANAYFVLVIKSIFWNLLLHFFFHLLSFVCVCLCVIGNVWILFVYTQVRLTFGGYNDKLEDFAKYITKQITTNLDTILPKDAAEFDRYQDLLLRNFAVRSIYREIYNVGITILQYIYYSYNIRYLFKYRHIPPLSSSRKLTQLILFCSSPVFHVLTHFVIQGFDVKQVRAISDDERTKKELI